MALKATIYKADLNIADMDRNYYQEHALTIARHPSETDERVMIRLLAFALHADPALTFGKDLFDVEEPALWLKDLTGLPSVRSLFTADLPDWGDYRVDIVDTAGQLKPLVPERFYARTAAALRPEVEDLDV